MYKKKSKETRNLREIKNKITVKIAIKIKKDATCHVSSFKR